MMNKPKIALIEVTPFHEECLYTQIQYLKSRPVHLTLIVNRRLPISFNLNNVDELVYIDTEKKLNKSLSWLRVYKHVIKNKIKTLIFNTAESFIYKLIRLPYPASVQLIGLLHNAQKLQASRKQKYISKKIDKYLVLSEFIKESIESEQLFDKPVGVFKPILFPNFKTRLQKPQGEIWITIPGTVNFNKRDYNCLNSLEMPNNFKIILLGKPEDSKATAFLSELGSSKNSGQFILFDSFIDFDLFHSYISQSDFIMPLIHPINESFDSFLKYKISGSYNLAYGYNVPLLMEKEFKEINEFKTKAHFYDYKNMGTLIQSIKNQIEVKLTTSKHRENTIEAFNIFILE